MLKAFVQSTTVLHKIKPLYQKVIDFCAPASCVVCRNQLMDVYGMGVCPNCYQTLPFWDEMQISKPDLPSHIDGFEAPFLYENEIQKMITTMKFGDKCEYVSALSALLYSTFLEVYEDGMLVLPVPMHGKRLRKRMFNQSAVLVQSLYKLKSFKFSLTDFVREKHTKPQVGQSAISRRKNLKNAFKILIDVQGQSILLIDDVWTTGSTAEACAKCLKQAGAKSVTVLTLAYVEKPNAS
jgi:ComF family protein